MKNIIRAMSETKYKPQPKWWGFILDTKNVGKIRFLMRYGHIMSIFSEDESKVLFCNYKTVTDKKGVEFAIKYFKEKFTRLTR